MAEILTNQADLDRIFKKMEKDFGKLNKRQQAYAVREIGRVRGELADMLAEHADSSGVISRRRAGMVLRELDAIEESLRKKGTIAVEHIAKESSEFTSRAIGLGLMANQFDRVNEHVIKYILKRQAADGLVLSERVWDLSGEIRDELATVIRSGIIKGEGINSMIPKLRKVYDNESWKIRRLARNESLMAHRAAVSYNAQESDVVKWVEFHAGVKRSPECVALENEDRYGKGRGIYKPSDTDIWQPHVNCTGYISYVIDERRL